MSNKIFIDSDIAKAETLPASFYKNSETFEILKEKLQFQVDYKIKVDTTIILSPRGWRPDYNHIFILDAFSELQKFFKMNTTLIFISMGKEIHQTHSYEEIIKEIDRKNKSIYISAPNGLIDLYLE